MRKKIISLGLLFICILSSIYIPKEFKFNTDSDSKKDNIVKLSSSSWESYTITQGSNLFEDYPYDFSVKYYDTIDYSINYSLGYLETQYLLDSDLYTNNSFSVNNTHNAYANSLNINQGSLESSGTLDVLDNNYYDVSSTNLESSTVAESNDFEMNSSTVYQNGTEYIARYTFKTYNEGDTNIWGFNEYGVDDIEVVQYLDGHKKILKIPDTSTIGFTELRSWQFYTHQHDSNIELWVRKESGDTGIHIVIRGDTPYGDAVWIRIDENNNGKFQYNDGSWQDITVDYSDNIWYHLRIHFDTSTQTFDFYVDNMLVLDDGDFYASVGYIYWIDIETSDPNRAYTGVFYIDALDYGWYEYDLDPYDPDKWYPVGDYYINRNQDNYFIEDDGVEGSLSEYLLDDYTIFNSTYFYNTSEYSDLTVEYGTINQNGSLLEIDDDFMSFDSEGIDVFIDYENDTIATDPPEWTINEGTGSDIAIYDYGSSYDQLIKWIDSSASASTMDHIPDDDLSGDACTVEFDWRVDSVTNDIGSSIFGDNGAKTICYTIFGYNGGLRHYKSTGGFDVLGSWAINTWYHIKYEINFTTQTWDWIINGGTIGDDLPFYTTTGVNEADRIRHWSYSAQSSTSYWDNLEYRAEQKINFTYTFDASFVPKTLHYSFNNSQYQFVNVSFYNFDNLEWDSYINGSYSSFSLINFTNFNSSYYNSTNFVSTRFESYNSTNVFNINLEVLRIEDYKRLNFTCDISLSGFSSLTDLNLVYAFNTTLYQDTSLYIYNFTSLSYVLVDLGIFQYSNMSANTRYALTSDLFNSTNNIKLNFYMYNTTEDINLWLYRLGIVSTTYLNITYEIDLYNIEDILQFDVSSFYKTNIDQLINHSIYNIIDDNWILINSSSNILSFFESSYSYNSSDIYEFINISRIKLIFYTENYTGYEFNLHLDMLETQVYRKACLSYEQSFNILGTYKYRFYIWNSTDWIINSWTYFDVVGRADNLELISESEYVTRWDFSTTTPDYIYNEEFNNGSREYYLQDTILDFAVDEDEYDNYLTDNITDYWDVGTQIVAFGMQISWAEDFEIFNDLFWVLDSNQEFVKTYYFNGTYTGDQYNYNGNYISAGFIHNGSYFYLLDLWQKRVYQFDELWNQITYWYIGSIDSYIDSLYYYDGYWWLMDSNSNFVYKCYDNFTYTGSSWDLNSIDNELYDLTRYDDKWWAVGEQHNSIHTFDNNWNYIKSFSVSSETTHPDGIAFYNGSSYMTFDDGTGWGSELWEYQYPSISKIYQDNSNSYMYIQTNINETLSLISPILNIETEEENVLEISFNTTCENQIDLKFLGIDKTLLESFRLQNNSNTLFTERELTFELDSVYNIYFIEIVGIFNNINYMVINYIQINNYNNISTYVDPDGYKTYYLNFPISYTYRIYENNVLKEIGTIITTENLQSIVYERVDQNIIHVSYYDINNNYLNFHDYITYSNYTSDNIDYSDKYLISDIMYVDISTNITFKIYDSFNSLVKTYDIQEETYIDIVLPVYSLKILNKASKDIIYTLESNDTSFQKDGKLFPNEIKEFHIASGIYNLNYTNYENDQDYTDTINLTDNYLYTVNSTYFDVYFSIFNFDGLGLDPNLFRFYINNERKDFGFNTLIQDINNLVVRDFFNYTLKDTTIDLRPYTEYSLSVEVYTLILNNKFNRTVKFEITRSDTNIIFEQTINTVSSLSYRFLTDIIYTIDIYEINGIFLEQHEVNLTDNNMIVDFGFYSEVLPIDPTPIIFSYQVLFFFALGLFVVIIVGVVLFVRLRKKSEEQISYQQYKNRKNNKGYNFQMD